MEPRLFRKEAFDHHVGARADSRRLLVGPNGSPWFYALLLTLVVAGTLFLVFGTVAEYAAGTAVIRSRERVSVTTTSASVIASLTVQEGQQVSPGDVLVSLYAADEEAQITAIQREFDANLLRMLAAPSDRGAGQAVARLRAQRDLLLARRNERLLRSPDSGVVRDIRVRAGQSMNAGDIVLSIVTSLPGFVAHVALPGEKRPLLRAGLPMRLELKGMPYSYHMATIEAVGDEIVSVPEVRRLLGTDSGDGLTVGGQQVIVRAPLADTFEFDGAQHRYVDGMQATARVQLRRRRLISLLVPGFQAPTSAP